MNGRPAYELYFALIALVAITGGYAYLAQDGPPQPGSLTGHLLGIVGFLLMLSTETLYSLRKRLQGFHYGPMSIWLQAHIFTGIVGAYLVFLHAAWKFKGLAGILMLVTLVVVLSGIVGRYIYTAVPRSLDGAELAVVELEDKIALGERKLKKLGLAEMGQALTAATTLPTSGWLLVLGRPYIRWRQKRKLHQVMLSLDDNNRAYAGQMQTVLLERQRLLMQIKSLDTTRRMLALWHLFHIPLSAALFVLAVVHIVGALYYSTFLK